MFLQSVQQDILPHAVVLLFLRGAICIPSKRCFKGGLSHCMDQMQLPTPRLPCIAGEDVSAHTGVLSKPASVLDHPVGLRKGMFRIPYTWGMDDSKPRASLPHFGVGLLSAATSPKTPMPHVNHSSCRPRYWTIFEILFPVSS